MLCSISTKFQNYEVSAKALVLLPNECKATNQQPLFPNGQAVERWTSLQPSLHDAHDLCIQGMSFDERQCATNPLFAAAGGPHPGPSCISRGCWQAIRRQKQLQGCFYLGCSCDFQAHINAALPGHVRLEEQHVYSLASLRKPRAAIKDFCMTSVTTLR